MHNTIPVTENSKDRKSKTMLCRDVYTCNSTQKSKEWIKQKSKTSPCLKRENRSGWLLRDIYKASELCM